MSVRRRSANAGVVLVVALLLTMMFVTGGEMIERHGFRLSRTLLRAGRTLSNVLTPPRVEDGSTDRMVRGQLSLPPALREQRDVTVWVNVSSGIHITAGATGTNSTAGNSTSALPGGGGGSSSGAIADTAAAAAAAALASQLRQQQQQQQLCSDFNVRLFASLKIVALSTTLALQRLHQFHLDDATVVEMKLLRGGRFRDATGRGRGDAGLPSVARDRGSRSSTANVTATALAAGGAQLQKKATAAGSQRTDGSQGADGPLCAPAYTLRVRLDGYSLMQWSSVERGRLLKVRASQLRRQRSMERDIAALARAERTVQSAQSFVPKL